MHERSSKIHGFGPQLIGGQLAKVHAGDELRAWGGMI
jgi:hypothetical protein